MYFDQSIIQDPRFLSTIYWREDTNKEPGEVMWHCPPFLQMLSYRESFSRIQKHTTWQNGGELKTVLRSVSSKRRDRKKCNSAQVHMMEIVFRGHLPCTHTLKESSPTDDFVRQHMWMHVWMLDTFKRLTIQLLSGTHILLYQCNTIDTSKQ